MHYFYFGRGYGRWQVIDVLRTVIPKNADAIGMVDECMLDLANGHKKLSLPGAFVAPSGVGIAHPNRLTGAEPAQLEAWGERVLEAATLEAVFAEG
ncbi:MAG TPA: hypothetical protein GX399_13540 [Xanthomonadaceae bacterium]|nr:hypothetical protein [Xanthomonadaceae bacterium]